MINSPFSLCEKKILVIGQGEICSSICIPFVEMMELWFSPKN